MGRLLLAHMAAVALLAPCLASAQAADDVELPPPSAPPLPGEAPPDDAPLAYPPPALEEDALRPPAPKQDLRPRVDPERLAEAKGQPAPPAPSNKVATFYAGGLPATLIATSTASFLVSGLTLGAWVYATKTVGLHMVSVSLLPGAATGVFLSTLLLPQVMTWIGDDAEGVGDVHAARARGWELSRWAVLTGGVGALMLVSGTLSKEDGLSRWGLGTAAVSWFAYWVLQSVGVVDGYQKSRRSRPKAAPAPAPAFEEGDRP